MLIFETSEVRHGLDSMQAACLVTPPPEIQEDTQKVLKDGQELELPIGVVGALVNTIKVCDAIEKDGFAVDCAVFGAVMLGGSYIPVEKNTYRHGLNRRIEFGRWLCAEEILGDTDVPELVQFGSYERRFLPSHAAVKLPSTQGLFVQKAGHHLPVTITDGLTNLRFYTANTAAAVNNLSATFRGEKVLAYEAGVPSSTPLFTYIGLPG